MQRSSTRQPQAFGRTVKEENGEPEIRRRAYELYEARGRGDGHDVEDWLEAETEICGESEKAAA